MHEVERWHWVLIAVSTHVAGLMTFGRFHYAPFTPVDSWFEVCESLLAFMFQDMDQFVDRTAI